MLDKLWDKGMLFSPDDASAGGGGEAGGKPGEGEGEPKPKEGEGEAAPSYKDWFAKQPKEVQALVTENEAGLKGALTSERETRKDLETKVRDLAKGAEKGGELEKQLTLVADELQSANSKTDFYEEAHSVGITNLKLAWLLVDSTPDLLDKRGNVDFDAMKKSNPELFVKVAPKPTGTGGEGTGSVTPAAMDMNAKIRKAAGW